MVKKTEFMWNILASTVSSIINAVLLMFCTRINGIEIAGMFSIAFATSSILNAVGDYGIRPYQVTDTNRKYKFGEYLSLRIIIVSVMFIIGTAFVIISRYEFTKAMICLFLVLYRVIDNLSESYQSEFQIQGRLDIGCKSVVIRNIAAIIIFLVINYLTRNIIFATIAMVLINLLIFIIYDLNKIKSYTTETPNFNKVTLKKLLMECFPVCISTLLSLFLANVVKYSIDMYGNYDMQTYYNIVFLPTFTINLASTFIVKPMFKSFGELWNSGNTKKLNKLIIIIAGITALATGFIELVCYFIGPQILQLIYGVELSQYRNELLTLLIAGFFFAIANLMIYITTTIRKQGYATIIYLIVSVFAIFISNYMVRSMQIMGASIANLMIAALLAIMLIQLYVLEIYKMKKKISIRKKYIKY